MQASEVGMLNYQLIEKRYYYYYVYHCDIFAVVVIIFRCFNIDILVIDSGP